MSNENKLILAKENYKNLCAALDSQELMYVKHDKVSENFLTCEIGFSGDGLNSILLFTILPNVEMLTAVSPLPFVADKEKYSDILLALNFINDNITGIKYSLDTDSGSISLTLSSDYTDTVLSEGVFNSMLCLMLEADHANTENLYALNKGYISIDEFIKKCIPE